LVRYNKITYLNHIELRDLLNDNNKVTWASENKCLLDNLGYSYLWNTNNIDTNYMEYMFKQRLRHMFKQRLRNKYVQAWNETVANKSKLSYYRQFKTLFVYEKNLDFVKYDIHRKNVSSKVMLTFSWNRKWKIF
jgi:hypothetical protein